jgi:hypothetical protein
MSSGDKNLESYSSSAAIEQYTVVIELSACEEYLFGKYVHRGQKKYGPWSRWGDALPPISQPRRTCTWVWIIRRSIATERAAFGRSPEFSPPVDVSFFRAPSISFSANLRRYLAIDRGSKVGIVFYVRSLAREWGLGRLETTRSLRQSCARVR